MDIHVDEHAQPPKKQKFYQILYVQVIFAIIAGIILGHYSPEIGESLKPLGVSFINLVKMIIAPVIFLYCGQWYSWYGKYEIGGENWRNCFTVF